ncbi:MAG: hypothetical protein QOI53_2060, partial [Verrucomicrobiota bacterium]|nr:hypothetical protein [Verrucomicrobiota bacterium]
AHRRGRREERRGNFRGPNSEYGLQHQGCPGGGIDRRVGTDKKQLQSIVREMFMGGGNLLRFLRNL